MVKDRINNMYHLSGKGLYSCWLCWFNPST